MKRSPFLILAFLLVLTACGGPSFKGSVVQKAPMAADFTLTDQNGQPFRLSDERGRALVLFFGYSFCPDECPTTLVMFNQANQLLGADASKVRFVLITVDPERDTVDRLKQYLKAFSPDFVGLTGTPAELQPVYKAYGVYVEKDAPEAGASGYSVKHTLANYLIDPAGHWRVIEDYNTPAADLTSDVRILLKG